MNNIIGPSQNAFIEGRQILAPVLTAREVVQDYSAKKKKRQILKIDLEEAFDRVDRGFLEKVLHCKKFGPHWISWIVGSMKNP